jgi:hypothetical protein
MTTSCRPNPCLPLRAVAACAPSASRAPGAS